MKNASSNISALVFLLSLVFLCFYSADASLTKQNARAKFRGSTRMKAHGAAAAKQSTSEDDDDDDDDDEDDNEDDVAASSAKDKGDSAKKSVAPIDKKALAKEEDELEKEMNPHAKEDVRLEKAVASAQQQLTANVRKQAELKHSIEYLSNDRRSNMEIETSTKQVANETSSPAMGDMLGGMWKDMRMFEMPFYAEHVQEEIHHLKKEERVLEAKVEEAQGKLRKSGKKGEEQSKATEDSDDGEEKLSNVAATSGEPHYGSPHCQCIGIDELDGSTTVKVSGEKVSFPADLGARCEAWDAKKHPDCPGESWCEQKWCYVDPCKCKNLPALPKPTTYLPDANYQGKPVHYSYATCGGSDSFSKKEMKKTAKEIQKTCAVKVDSKKWGAEGCRCIGMGPQAGNTKVVIKGKQRKFPADTGAFCQSWEEDNHPDCKGESPPDWCSQAWCYVDPCSCNLPTPPKTSSYLPDSNYQGKAVYFSYATCGGKDAWTAGQKDACVNQKTSEDCAALQMFGTKKCGWIETKWSKMCLGKDLVDVCKVGEPQESAAWSPRAIMTLALPLLGLAL